MIREFENILFSAAVLVCFLVCAPAQTSAAGPVEGTIGVNKFDLLLQYLGTASGGDGSARYRKVTEAMARKAIADAASAGIHYFRISATGYAPSGYGLRGDLELWHSDRDAYWKLFDRMVADLSDNGIQLIPSFIWNLQQFPAMARETVRDLVVDPKSRSYLMLDEYVSQFVTRYRSSSALLFYEIGNELNLNADLDLAGRCIKSFGPQACEAQGNFTTDEMIIFMGRIANRIRALDPARLISSGHSFPRPSAQHLRRAPEFSRGGPDWTEDGPDELAAYLEVTHMGFEVMSVHIYESEPMPAFAGLDHAELIALVSRLASQLKKTLFIGEIGARSANAPEPHAYLDRMLASIESRRVPYTAFWVWEFYQTSTYRSFDHQNTYFNIEPGYSDWLIRRITKMNGVRLPVAQKTRDDVPPIVVITWPLECARVDGAFKVHVAASDDSGIAPKVEVRRDQQRMPTSDRPPYEFGIEGLTSGEHDLTAIAEDGSGNRATWASTVVVGALSSASGQCKRCCN